jgi:hypothetical protein
MNVPDPKDNGDQARPPCGHCHSTDTTGHCVNPRCTWVKCKACQLVSDTRRLKRNQGNT